MKRRTFVKSALAAPLLGIPPAPTRVIGTATEGQWDGKGDSATGLRPLDVVMSPTEPRTIVCVNYPPAAGKAVVLLELASRICERFPANVILAGADGSVVDVRQWLARRAVPPRHLSANSEPPPPVDDPSATGPGVHSVDSTEMDRIAAYVLAVRLRRKPLFGYSLLILKNWSTFIDHARPFRTPSALCIPQQVQVKLWAAALRLSGRLSRHYTESELEVLTNFMMHGATEEEYQMFKAINEHHWPSPDDYEAETEFVTV